METRLHNTFQNLYGCTHCSFKTSESHDSLSHVTQKRFQQDYKMVLNSINSIIIINDQLVKTDI